MTCDRCSGPITGGYWIYPAPDGPGVVVICRACVAAPRYPVPHEPSEEATRRMYEVVKWMMKAPNN